MTCSDTSRVVIPPMDTHNQALVKNVHPSDWVNPEPAPLYDLVVIGAGAAGLCTSAIAKGIGAKVALIEEHLFGGDCLNTGCVPSKSILRAARAITGIGRANRYGIHLEDEDIKIDFTAVMKHMRKLRAYISNHDSVHRFRDMGVDIFLGHGEFANNKSVRVGDKTLHFKRAVIATGARAAKPSIVGLDKAHFYTNETIFSLTKCPDHLAVLGGGPIGCELSQAFRQFGSKITIIEKGLQLLPREDPESSALLAQTFDHEGIKVKFNTQLNQVTVGNRKQLSLEKNGNLEILEVDEILVSVGRTPNVSGLNLKAAGVKYDNKGIHVNDFLQTSSPRIYAAGDVCMEWKFTHAADAAARIVIQNALFLRRKRLSSLVMPWCTYTDPEIAHVGMYENEARKKGIKVDTFVKNLNEVDRGIIDDEKGFVKLLLKKGSDKIIGATIVGTHAGEMIGEVVLAIVAGVGLKTLSTVIHPYPTQSEAIKQIGDIYNRNRLTPVVKTLFSVWLSWIR